MRGKIKKGAGVLVFFLIFFRVVLIFPLFYKGAQLLAEVSSGIGVYLGSLDTIE